MLFETRKALIQSAFERQTGLRIDYVKAGVGNTNDGNTARRFFANPTLSAQLTGFDEEILKRLSVVLEVISSYKKVDSKAFHTYAMRTYELMVQKYGWYWVPAGVHRVLMHGARIIDLAPMALGMLSEEAQEARNKDYRYFRYVIFFSNTTF